VPVVPEPNNRVELRYEGEDRRRASGCGAACPPWLWPELSPLVAGLRRASTSTSSPGFELELDTARALARRYRGPTYADLHSLFLGMGAAGLRVPRELPLWHDWLKCFDAVQVNEDEFGLLGRAWGDPWGSPRRASGPSSS
jgi:hypothetical protein